MKKILIGLLVVAFTFALLMGGISCKQEVAEETTAVAATTAAATSAATTTATSAATTTATSATEAPSPLGKTATELPVVDLKPGSKIGLSFSDQSQQVWQMEAKTSKDSLEKLGYTVVLEWADVKPAVQIQQIENMILTGCKAIIIIPVDAGSLGSVLKQAKDANVLIIDLDLMMTNTPDIDYYVGFDNYNVTGKLQAQFIEDKLNLKSGAGPFNMEIMTGSLDEVNTFWYYDRQMEILKPYMDSGKLVVPSGQTALEVCTIKGWSADVATARMENLITANYSDGKQLDAVLSPSDVISVACANALKNAGWGTASKPMPIITGNNGTASAIQSILAGGQTMTLFKDTRVLADACAELIDKVAKGQLPQPNDLKIFDNGVITIPAFVYGMEVVTKDNWKQVMVDSGFYTLDQLGVK